ncbi:MAG: acetyltransferase, partial [Myxococcota bacterium]
REPIPTDFGTSTAWRLPPYTLERILIGAAQRDFAGYDAAITYTLPGDTAPVFSATVVDGWKTIEVKADLGNPPAPSYLWDVLLEVGQVRLHDGGIPEGAADVRLTLSDVPIGLSPQVIEQTIRENLEADPSALLDIATRVVDNTSGAADLYYVHLGPEFPGRTQGDYLAFITAQDIRLGEGGTPERPYTYAAPGFFGDEELLDKRSSPVELAAGLSGGHEVVRIETGDILYVEDDEGRVFRLEVGHKPSASRRMLTITRTR